MLGSPFPSQEQAAKDRKDSGPLPEQELVTGLKAYFNRASFLLLMYPQERAQAEEVCSVPCEP